LPKAVQKSLWPRLTLGRPRLTLFCLDASILSWWMHGCYDNHMSILTALLLGHSNAISCYIFTITRP
jgi:hypothetical protein